MAGNRLREGFTTGTAAAAAAKGALERLLTGDGPLEVDVPLPREGRLVVPVESSGIGNEGAEAVVIKDAGDDPDATHKARIRAVVRLVPNGGETRVTVRGGTGVGRVTRPGLPVPVGDAAINPAPRLQIEAAVREAMDRAGRGGEVIVTLEVEDGERIARKTLNPRLGILGGISILGTRGTVKPFSNQAYRDTITMSLDVARAAGLTAVALSTGGRSERLLRERLPDLPEAACVQVADFFAFSLEEASARGFETVLYACFFGKLVKMAQGHPYTHARKSRIDFRELASWCASAGLDREGVAAVERANTSREAMETIQGSPAAERILEVVLDRAARSARRFLDRDIDLVYYLFGFDESLFGIRRDGPSRREETP
jgi:cobalt-precorrin-5B (C1)-methyltransferase